MSLKNKRIKLNDEDISKLVKAFTWLIQEDKKQNPELYKKKDII